jgi:excisionase family DNA binding protein
MLTVKQAAESLSISTGLLYALVALGRIRHERYGLGRGTIRISEEALQEFRQSRTVAPAESGSLRPAPALSVKLKHLSLD